MKVITACLCVTLPLISCTRQHAKDMEHIENLRGRAEQLVKARSLMGWNSWAYGNESNQDSLYKANAELFTLENIARTRRAEGNEPDSTQKKRLLYFRRYLTDEYIAKEIAYLNDKVNNLESSSHVTLDGKEVPYGQVSALIRNEKNQKRREALYVALNPVLDSINTLLTQIEAKNQSLAKELGYGSYNEMAADLKGISLDHVKPIAERILDETEASYLTLLAQTLKERLGLAPDKFYRYDTEQLVRTAAFDAYFPASSIMDILKRTYKGLGVDLDASKNLSIGPEPREKKNPRAVCYPVDVPNDVRLSIKPSGGFDDYSALFHEAGHGVHYANTKEHAFEFKYLGEPTVTENFAFLSEYLLTNQAWLRVNTKMPTPVLKDFLRQQALIRLYMIRRYAAKFLYELHLHSGGANPQAAYADLQSRALGIQRLPSDEKRYLTDPDALYCSASCLRAWFLEAQLNAKLTKDYGANWFENPQAGRFLLSLWASGERLDGDEFVRLLGYDAISPDVLLAEVNTMLLFSSR
jgi:hypothetical protein